MKKNDSENVKNENIKSENSDNRTSSKKSGLFKRAADKKDQLIEAAAEKKDELLETAADNISNTKDTKLDKAIDNKFNSRRTTIRMRIIRLGTISVTVAAFVFSLVSVIIFHRSTLSNNETKLLDLSSAYMSAVDNADILKNNRFLDNLFHNYVTTDANGSFGFILNSNFVVFSETEYELMPKSLNLMTKSEEDPAYKPLYKLASKNYEDKEKSGHSIIRFNGERYLIAYTKSETYDGFYTYLMSPYNAIMSSFNHMLIIYISIFLFLIALEIIISTKISGKITRPINDVVKRLKKLAEGDVTSPAPGTNRNDETRLLVDSLEETVNSLHTYIDDIHDVLSAIASGDLLITSKVKYSGDFQDIRRCLDKILNSLNATFNSVNESAKRVKQYSDQVSTGATVLSGNASGDAATIEELTSSISIISDKVGKNAEQAKTARSLTKKTNRQVTVSSNAMKEMVTAIEDMQRYSDEIAKIIKVIDDIAFQTNILALNAAVEASKAGAAGKGFAVVADEVRNLATKSANAASQTGKLIRSSISSMEKSAELAQRASEALSDVVVNVRDIDGLVDSIAVSAEDQATDIETVNGGMEQINGSIQTTSATAEESATASGELAGQSEDLNYIINKFRFKDMMQRFD